LFLERISTILYDIINETLKLGVIDGVLGIAAIIIMSNAILLNRVCHVVPRGALSAHHHHHPVLLVVVLVSMV
jgi:hypothetical protein